MQKQQEIHTKGFLLEHKERNTLLWLRRDGVQLNQISGSVSFDERCTYEEIEYAARYFVHGVSFREFCAQNTFVLSSFVKTIKEAMRGIQVLHEQNILHGKITADNLILSAYDEQPIWVDHINEGSKESDWEQFWALFLSQKEHHDVGVEFFCVQLNNEENKQDFVEKWSQSPSQSLWDRKCLQDFLC